MVAAHKSVALLGLVGRAEDMHAILDTETEATLAYLDAWMTARGGRRGRSQTRVPTNGLVWARTRHATSRAGDPEPHEHILIANLCHISDEKGGWKALDTAALRDILHAATAFGRVASAAKAVELGYAIEPDDGPSGKLGHWRIAGMPEGACELFSKRSAEITAAVEHQGYDTYQARQVAARDTRKAKRHTPPADLVAGWLAQLSAAGYSRDGLLQGVEQAAAGRRRDRPAVLNGPQLSALAGYLLGPSGRLADQKVFTRADVAVAAGPLLFGFGPRELLRVIEAVCAHPDAVPLMGVKAAREQAYAPACAIANEAAIALKAALQAERGDAPALAAEAVSSAIGAKERELDGRSLTGGQRAMVAGVATSGRGVELVVGVAGSGKSTALDAARRAFEGAGFRVLGAAVSGQAARTLGTEAGIDDPRTIASLLWRLDHGKLKLDRQTVVVCDEAGMADDPAMLRLLAATEAAGSKLVMIGDHRQIGAVGPAGASKRSFPVIGAACTCSQRMSARSTPMSAPFWQNCGPAKSTMPSTGTPSSSGSRPHRAARRCSSRWLPTGQKTLRKGGKAQCLPGGGQMSPRSTPEPGRPWHWQAGCRDRKCTWAPISIRRATRLSCLPPQLMDS